MLQGKLSLAPLVPCRDISLHQGSGIREIRNKFKLMVKISNLGQFTWRYNHLFNCNPPKGIGVGVDCN